MAKEAPKTMITSAGLKKYEEELQNLKVVRRQEVAKKIKVAREQGDLSENADYDAAKEEQTEIENRIAELEALLKNVELVSEEEFVEDKINVGSYVKLYDCAYDEEVEFHIVGSSEANSLLGRISNESPVGAALMGHFKDETVDVKLADGTVESYKILEVRKMEE
ncbi:MAG: transcription elongation factor GreA [Eubacteriales bacterium]|nr:transcription elongation factor GreA [Eubacteriales bacterium]